MFYNAAAENKTEVLSKMVEKLGLQALLTEAELKRFSEMD